jgi:large subunit ribosomal protein L41
MLASLLSAFARKRFVPARGWKVLSSKEAPKLNKGKRAMKAGFVDQWGRFVVVPSMLPQYKVPDLTDFKLKPYVAQEQKAKKS